MASNTLGRSPFFGRFFGNKSGGSDSRRASGSWPAPAPASASQLSFGGGASGDSLGGGGGGGGGFKHLAFSMENASGSGGAASHEDLVNAAAAMLLAAADDESMPSDWTTLPEAGADDADDAATDPDAGGADHEPVPALSVVVEPATPTFGARPRRNSYHDLTAAEAAVAPLDRRAVAWRTPASTPAARTPGPAPSTPGAAASAPPPPMLTRAPSQHGSTTLLVGADVVDDAYEDTVDATLAAIPVLRRAPATLGRSGRLRAAVRSVVAARRLATFKSELERRSDSPDGGPNVLSLLVNASGQAVVASGTVDARLDMMIADGEPNAQQMYDFLSTYRYFITGPDLLTKLVQRHEAAAAIQLPTFVVRNLDGEVVELPRQTPLAAMRPASVAISDSQTSLSRSATSASSSPHRSPRGGLGSPRGSIFGTASPPPSQGPAAGAKAAALVSGSTDEPVVVRQRASLASAAAPRASLSPRASMDVESALQAWAAERAPVAMPENEVAGVRRLRVVNVLRTWVMRHPEDFAAGSDLHTRLDAFVNVALLTSGAEARYGRSILELLRQSAGGRASSALAVSAKRPIVARFVDAYTGPPSAPKDDAATAAVASASLPTRTGSLLLQKPQALAQQLTLIEKEMFSRVYQRELVMQGWAKSDRAERAPNLLKFIHWFNQVSTWVTTEVCSGASVKQRVAIIRVFLEVARYCLYQHNFSGVFEIVVGLTASPVARLKKTWKAMPSKAMEIWEDLARLIAPQGNFAVYRQMLKTAAFPVIPYIGMHMSDLTFTEDGSPSTLLDGRINFFKFHLVGKILNDVRNYQQAEYAFAEDPALLGWMEASIHGLSIEQLTKISRALEPPVDV